MSKASKRAKAESEALDVLHAEIKAEYESDDGEDTMTLAVVTGDTEDETETMEQGVPYLQVAIRDNGSGTHSGYGTFSAEDALAMAAWIIETFGDE